jgi:hypothetical protein
MSWSGGGGGVSLADLQAAGLHGYEFTGGFADRTDGAAGSTDVGTDVNYTSTQASAGTWRRFGFSSAANIANDSAYWTSPTPAPTAGVGLFGGDHMPHGVTSLIDFAADDTEYNQATSFGSLSVTAATGSFDFSECAPGDLARVRFDINITPQVADTTVEFCMIWQTRDDQGVPTFTFPLTGTPHFFGSAAAGETYLVRQDISAYFASDEDVAARALLAVRADQQFICQPLTTLIAINR